MMHIKLVPPPDNATPQPIAGYADVIAVVVACVLLAAVAWLSASCMAERKVEGGVYIMPSGEAMPCVKALRSSCGWTWFGCGIGGETFGCMPKPEVSHG